MKVFLNRINYLQNPFPELRSLRKRMEKEEINAGGGVLNLKKPLMEAEKFSLQWGSKKRIRCVRVRGNIVNPFSAPKVLSSSLDNNNNITSSRVHRKIHTVSHKDVSFPSRQARHMEMETNRSEMNRKIHTVSTEKDERFYMTRGSTAAEEHGKKSEDRLNNQKKLSDIDNCSNKFNGGGLISSTKLEWPKLCIALSSKEKEEDFMAMKGCRLPHRPKKRAKVIQKTLLLVSPGAWLTDMSWERYEIRDKKTTKKKARGGLKGMGSSNIESDSE